MNNKKGLSTVVATLIIILLVLVAVGILWVVLQNVFTQGAATVELSQKCLEVKIDVAGVVQTGVNTGIYDVSLRRNSGGETIGGVKLNFFNGTSNSGILDFAGANLTELATKTLEINTANVTQVVNATKMEYTVYFIDDTGNEQACTSTGTKTLG